MKKLISSQSKKKLEKFFFESLEDYNPGDNLSESSENCPPGRGQNRVIEILRQRVIHQSNIVQQGEPLSCCDPLQN